MPTSTTPKKSQSGRGFPETAWVKCDLSDEQKNFLKGQEVSDAELMEGMAALAGEGYKISLSYDQRSDCIGVYITSPEKARNGALQCLSARAPSMAQAVAVLLYKHYTLLAGDWGTAAGIEGSKDKWG